MNTLITLYDKLKCIQDDASKALLKECLAELEESELVNNLPYRSRHNRKRVYDTCSTASIARLIEKKSSNFEVAALLCWPDQRIADIRLGRIRPIKSELAEICIALDLYEHTIKRLFEAFEYLYDIDKFPNDLYLHIIVNSEASAAVKLRMFRNLLK